MNIKKMAAKDAFDWARAEMFFGEGAGTQRKLLSAEIHHKIMSIPGYQDAFSDAYNGQDFAEHAIKAAKLRKKLDHVSFVKKNTRAIVRGDVRNISPSLIVGAVAVVLIHEMEYDKLALEKGKQEFKKAQAKLRLYKATREAEKGHHAGA